MKYNKTYLLLFLSLTFSMLSAQEEMTLEKAISIGLEKNYGIKISDQFIQIAENNNSWSRAGRTPTVDINGTFSNNVIQDNNPASFLQGSFYNGSLSASANANWVVYNGGRIRIAKDQLELAVSQQKLNKKADIHDLLRNVYQLYYTVVFANERLEVLDKSLILSKDRLAYEETKREFGASNSFNLIQFENAVLIDSTAMISQLQQIEIAKRNLYTTLNLDSVEDFVFSEQLNVTPEKIEIEKLEEILFEENYTLKSLEMLASLNQLNTNLSTASRKPTISVNGSLGFAENAFDYFGELPTTGQEIPLTFSNRISGSLGANLNWNLYDGGVRKDNIKNAKIQESIDQTSILEAKVALKNQLNILASNYNNQLELLMLSEAQLAVAQRNIEMTAERFKAAQVTSLDFRNVQTQYLSAAFSKVNAIYNLIITKSEIDWLVGRYENN